MKIVKGKNMPIGVDLGSSMLKLAQLQMMGDELSLSAAGAVEVPRGVRKDFSKRIDFVGEALKEVLKTSPFRGRQCVISIPAEATFVQHVKIAKVPPEQVAPAVAAELAGKLPFPANDAVIRHIISGDVMSESEAKQEVIAIAVPRNIVNSYIHAASKAKLDVIGINIEPCAIVECFARLFRRTNDVERTILFVDIGNSSTQVVLSHGCQIAFARNLMIGGEKLDQAVADGLKIPVEQASSMRRDLLKNPAAAPAVDELYRLLAGPLEQLSQELMQCVLYYETVFRNHGIERAIFVGGQAYDKRLCQMIAQKLNLAAQIGDPLMRCGRVSGAGFGYGLDRREPQPDWAVAVGLSLGSAA